MFNCHLIQLLHNFGTFQAIKTGQAKHAHKVGEDEVKTGANKTFLISIH